VYRWDYYDSVAAFRKNGRRLPYFAPVAGPQVVVSLERPELSRRPYWFDRLEALHELAGAEFVDNIIVHGSFGDATAVAYSDLDLTIVINRKELDLDSRRRALNRWIDKDLFPFLVSVDPLQHHGPFILWQAFADSYNERVLPISSYDPQRAWATRPVDLSFRIDRSAPTSFASLKCLDGLANVKRFFRYGFDVYSMKRFISNATLLPAYFMGDIGQPVHKAASFDLFARELGFIPELTHLAEQTRTNWKATPPRAAKIARLTSRSRVSYRAGHLIGRDRQLRQTIEHMSVLARELSPTIKLAIDGKITNA